MMKKAWIFIVLIITIAAACSKDDSVDEQVQIDIDLIEKYLLDSNLTAQSTSSGLHYIVTKEGTGVAPGYYSVVTVEYKGTLLDGTKFDSGTVEGYPLAYYIKGWVEGLPFFNEGGEGILFIPSSLGYGSVAKTKIPANSVLIFEIKLLEVAK